MKFESDRYDLNDFYDLLLRPRSFCPLFHLYVCRECLYCYSSKYHIGRKLEQRQHPKFKVPYPYSSQKIFFQNNVILFSSILVNIAFYVASNVFQCRLLKLALLLPTKKEKKKLGLLSVLYWQRAFKYRDSADHKNMRFCTLQQRALNLVLFIYYEVCIRSRITRRHL